MYLIGSKLLGIKNTKDVDYLEIIEGSNTYYKKNDNGTDVFYSTIDKINKRLNFEVEDKFSLAFQLFNYQFDQTLRKHFGYDDFPIKYNILDHKKELEAFLKYIKDNKLFNYDTRIVGKNNHISKQIFHIAYNKLILLNNSPILTEEQQEFVQRIHDKEVTWDEYIKKVGY